MQCLTATNSEGTPGKRENHGSGGGSDGVQRGREYGAAARDVPKLPGHAEFAPVPERSAEMAAGVSGDSGRVGSQRELS
jgi:hypothetical protein